MNSNEIEEVKALGFVGFKTVKELCIDSSCLPNNKGVYCVMKSREQPCEFLVQGCGGYFKGKNPNVSLEELHANWVNNTSIIYIGKAGAEGKNATLRSRLKQYLHFGQGKKVGHWGGRYIWQLKEAEELIICWKELPLGDPREYESNLINLFVLKHGKRPFANLVN